MRQEFLLLAGSIIHLSQLIEHNLRVIIFLDTRLDQKGRRLEKGEETADEVFVSIQKYPLGDLIDTASNFGVLSGADIKYLRTVTPKRNKIAHSYFKDAYLNNRFEKYGEEQKMLSELKAIETEFNGIHESILKIIANLERQGARK